ncbi:hypothetical protein IJ750_04520 [bacterium]|nr:hypothetical protein [bacterium]
MFKFYILSIYQFGIPKWFSCLAALNGHVDVSALCRQAANSNVVQNKN